MGGLLFITTMVVSNFLWMDVANPYIFLFTFVLFSMGLIGFADDYLKMKTQKGLSAKVKFLSQFTLIFCVAGYLNSEWVCSSFNQVMGFSAPLLKGNGIEGPISSFMKFIYIPFCKHPFIISSSFGLMFFTMFVLIGTANAVNLTDGLDGLATGCMLLVASVFAIIAFISNHANVASYLNILYIEGAGEIAIFLSSMIGALLGFLWFNGYPAQVFMGDTGSLALGGVIALTSIVLRREFLLSLVGGIFVIETASVILQILSFRLFGKRIFNCSPIHHHFQIKGWHESKIVIRFWMIGLILALTGLLSIKIQ
jgi:phospho-N-acetylmuramoyl-pentapeptide-transferase